MKLAPKVLNWLRIIVWNLHDKNAQPHNAIVYALRRNPHLVCLQEIPERAVRNINEKEYRVFRAVDTETDEQEVYLAILVHCDVKVVRGSHTVFDHNTQASDHWHDRKIGCKITCKQSHSVLIRFQGQVIQIINCHLPSACSIQERHTLLREIRQKHTEAHNNKYPIVMVGDWNTFGHPLINWIAWFFGVHLYEWGKNETAMLTKFVKQNDLRRVFGKKTTYPRTGAHLFFRRHLWGDLDHAVVTKGVFKKDCNEELLPSLMKSDHRGLVFDLELK